MEIVIITGPPYSGKGTQCKFLVKALEFKHISTGDRCRFEEESGSKIGKTMAEYASNGELVPDELMKELFDQILEENKHLKGIILDGYPRTIPQVHDLIDLADSKNMEITRIINIEVPTPEL